ncbi:hypothetical protein BZA05DRAFT_447899 [Tricharina praecox]|uniref:uncharacterized protein n=1 Tax=Tricharina praecox TaxID=43433 RepID=UPI00221FFF0D|nr:uncharacterized protein BZA05DRAFT_447899 [Tricharina praecox]KAI5845310.1 hypothetical protein BZA05DRAFT_447899 [Tricharina praecox]
MADAGPSEIREAENIGNRNESSPYGQGFGTNPAYGGFQQESNHHYGSESMDEFAAALNQLADETANLGMILTQNQIESSGENAQLRQAVYTLCAILDGTRPALQPSEIAAFSLSTSWTRAPRSGSSMRSVRQWRSLENRVHALSSVALRKHCHNWIGILEHDFMPSKSTRLAVASAETFEWGQNRMPSEYVVKKLRLLHGRAKQATEFSYAEEASYENFSSSFTSAFVYDHDSSSSSDGSSSNGE